jgi:hypothetical protein
MKTLSLILGAALLLLAAACSKNVKETATTKDGSKVTLEKKGDQVSYEIKSKSGEKVSLNVSEKGMKPMTELPKDLPVYSKAVLQMDNAVGPMRMLSWQTTDPLADVVKFYAEELKKQGWKIDTDMVMGEGHMFTTTKDNRTGQFMIVPDGKKTNIQLTLSTTG